MSVHILAIALLLALAAALALAVRVSLIGDKKPYSTPTPPTVTSAQAERDVVLSGHLAPIREIDLSEAGHSWPRNEAAHKLRRRDLSCVNGESRRQGTISAWILGRDYHPRRSSPWHTDGDAMQRCALSKHKRGAVSIH